jgi:hypothetical protein
MEDVNVSHGKTKMDKLLRGGERPCVRRSRLLCKGEAVRGAAPNFDGKKKMTRKQRRSKE